MVVEDFCDIILFYPPVSPVTLFLNNNLMFKSPVIVWLSIYKICYLVDNFVHFFVSGAYKIWKVFKCYIDAGLWFYNSIQHLWSGIPFNWISSIIQCGLMCFFLLWLVAFIVNMTWLHQLSWFIIMLIIFTSQVQIQYDIPKYDPLRHTKLELLQQYFVPPTKDAKGSKYSVNSFAIKFALIPNFIFVLLNNLDNIFWFFYWFLAVGSFG